MEWCPPPLPAPLLWSLCRAELPRVQVHAPRVVFQGHVVPGDGTEQVCTLCVCAQCSLTLPRGVAFCHRPLASVLFSIGACPLREVIPLRVRFTFPHGCVWGVQPSHGGQQGLRIPGADRGGSWYGPCPRSWCVLCLCVRACARAICTPASVCHVHSHAYRHSPASLCISPGPVCCISISSRCANLVPLRQIPTHLLVSVFARVCPCAPVCAPVAAPSSSASAAMVSAVGAAPRGLAASRAMGTAARAQVCGAGRSCGVGPRCVGCYSN
jgi:hypothetical protein